MDVDAWKRGWTYLTTTQAKKVVKSRILTTFVDPSLILDGAPPSKKKKKTRIHVKKKNIILALEKLVI